MTIPNLNDTLPINQYTASAGQTEFVFDFMIFDITNIKVYVNDVLKTITTDYLVKKSNNDAINPNSDYPLSGGKIVFNVGQTLGAKISLNRNVPIEKNSYFSVAGKFDSNTLNIELLKFLSIAQQLNRDIVRSLNLSPSDAGGGDLSIPTDRNGKLLGFDDNGNLITPLEHGDIQSQLNLVVANIDDIKNAASFNFPTLTNSDANKFLKVNVNHNGYDLVNGVNLNTLAALSNISNLTAFANLITSPNKILTFNGSGTMTLQNRPSNKNAIINGDFNIWQRGASFTSVAHATYTADRWLYLKSGAMVHDITLSNDVPTVAQAGRLITNSLKADCQTVDSSIASSDYAIIRQKIEGFNFIPLAQKEITVSFWVKATKTGIYSVHLTNSGEDRSCVKEFSINASNTWEFKTIVFPASPATGTWNYINGIGLQIGFTLASGSTFNTTPDSWQIGNFLGTSNQVNACDSTSNDFLITGVQLEEGNVATPFENRTFADELSLCQRYFQHCGSGFNGFEETIDLFSIQVKFPTIMRANPTLSLITTSISCRFPVGDVIKTGCSIQGATASTNYAAWVYIQHTNLGGSAGRQLQSRDGGNFIYANSEL